VKVVQLTPDFPPPLTGGGGYHVYNLARELVRKGVNVTVFTLNKGHASLLAKTEVEIHFGKVKVVRVPAFYIPKTTYAIAPQLVPLLLKEDADIIHTHGYQFFPSDVALLASKIKKSPLVLTLHGFPRDFDKLSHRAYFTFFGKEILRTASKIISVSQRVAYEFRSIGVPEEKITLVPNGVDLEEYKQLPSGDLFRKRLDIKEDERMLLTIGRLEKIKGFQYLIKALPSIIKEVGSTKLVIAGPEFSYGSELKQLVEETNVRDNVIFYGPINGKEKFEAFSAADIVTIPSLYEGFGILLLEAMAAGKPLIATSTGAAPEIIQNGKNGILVNPGDSEDLAGKVIKLLSDERLMSFISQESRKTVEAFDWEKVSEHIHKLYIDCLGSAK
jgi:glycosyltransferase involved in cell wall biosynthesis